MRWLVVPAALLTLGACAVPAERVEDRPPAFIEDLPPGVAALAASNQPLDKVRLMPEDGCYWYEYQGPVETLMVPLRAVGGGKICQALAAPVS